MMPGPRAMIADYRGGVTCLYDTQLLGVCLHASESGGRSRPEAVRGMPDVPIAPPATGPPEGWAAVGFVRGAESGTGPGAESGTGPGAESGTGPGAESGTGAESATRSGKTRDRSAIGNMGKQKTRLT